MLHLLSLGDEVEVWPLPGHKVHAAPPQVIETPSGVQVLPARELSSKGEKVAWTAWLHELARSGAVVFSDPSKNYARAVHVRHPHEVGANGKAAIELGARSEHELAHWKAMGHANAWLTALDEAQPPVERADSMPTAEAAISAPSALHSSSEEA